MPNSGAGHPLAETAVDQGGGDRRRCEGRRVVRETPDRGRIPQVRQRRAVVGGETVDEVLVEQVAVTGVAQIGVVDVQLMGNAVIGDLDEGAEILGDFAGVVEGGLIEGGVVVRGEVRRGGAGLGVVGVGEGCLEGDGERQAVLLAVAGDVAIELEVSAEFRQLRAERADMAGSAGLPGLLGEGRNGLGHSWTQQQDREQAPARRLYPSPPADRHPTPHARPGLLRPIPRGSGSPGEAGRLRM